MQHLVSCLQQKEVPGTLFHRWDRGHVAMDTLDREKVQQMERRAEAIAAMGLVDRVGDHFLVSTPSPTNNRQLFEVRRDDSGAVVCNCVDFIKAASDGSSIRCEHILAVKFALTARNTEPTARAAEASLRASTVNSPAGETTNTESRKSERGGQTSTIDTGDDAGNRPSVLINAGADRFETIHGDRKMK